MQLVTVTIHDSLAFKAQTIIRHLVFGWYSAPTIAIVTLNMYKEFAAQLGAENYARASPSRFLVAPNRYSARVMSHWEHLTL